MSKKFGDSGEESNKDSGFFQSRVKKRWASKYAIALYAVGLLNEGDAILIDAGTSLTPIAEIIRCTADKKSEQKYTHFTIMTHNNAAFESLSGADTEARLNVFQTGGRYDRDLNASFGHQAEMAYLKYHPKWVFIGQNGIEADMGMFCHGNTEELALKREIFAMSAGGRVIISDFTKIGSAGGLVFGSSDNLCTNVDECVILTDDPHDGQFEAYSVTEDQRRLRTPLEKFEIQADLLQTRYGAIVERVHFRIHELKKGEEGKLLDMGLWGNGPEGEPCPGYYRIYVLPDGEQEPENVTEGKAIASLDLEIDTKGRIRLEDVNLMRSSDGVSAIMRRRLGR